MLCLQNISTAFVVERGNAWKTKKEGWLHNTLFNFRFPPCIIIISHVY